MQVDQVSRPDKADLPEILASRKQGVERLQVPVGRIVVPADDIRAQANVGPPRLVGEGVADIRRDRPGSDVTVAEPAELEEALQIPPPATCRAEQARTERVAGLGAGALRVSARFPVSLSRTAARAARATYRIREQLLNELVYQAHVYGARPGTISFREKKAKQAPKA
jgi:hypothetical protein